MLRSRDRRTRVRSAVASLVLVLGVGSLSGGAGAQTEGGGSDLIAQFGGYELEAAGNGIVLTYDIKGALPVSPVFSLGLPEAQATQSSGSGYALASLAYPGPLVADLGTALKQGGTDAPIPPYPVRAQAFYPGDQTEARDETPAGADMVALAQETFSEGSSRYSGFTVPAAFRTGAVDVVSRTEIVDGKVVGRTRVEQSDISLFAGLIKIESVVTDIEASSDGEKGATKGTTSVNGVTVLGLDAVIDNNGVRLKEALPPPSTPLDPVEPITGPLGEAVKPVVEGAAPIGEQLSTVIRDALGQQKGFNDLLLASGIQIRVLQPVQTVEGGAASVSAGGVGVSMVYPGQSDERFAQLLALLPTDQLPSEGIPGAGFSPQAIVNLFKETHITDLAIASGSTSVVASPAFDFDDTFTPADTGLPGTGGELGSVGPVSGAVGGGNTAGSVPGSGVLANSGFAAGGAAVPLAAVLIMIFSAPMWAAASKRFAAATLEGASAACPYGKDSPFSPPGSSSRAQ